MKKFKIRYIPTYDREDMCSVWVYARNREDAKIVARSEYWDIEDIISVNEIN